MEKGLLLKRDPNEKKNKKKDKKKKKKKKRREKRRRKKWTVKDLFQEGRHQEYRESNRFLDLQSFVRGLEWEVKEEKAWASS